ncbi:BapA/Bap/LapF family prefix-like domain-containing protein [Phocoenobacter skyensis]|uniref:Biofilm-associated protein BapA-like prefix-like domain-containing protein n=1 Tax=Phocoenobacter skyensis TaxID=97481 RepID=A0ABT9JIS2_9PAST|nr:hypothetical protein [Pasteurella skyensis]MDP8078697.1 hypothetical protein [Pasteurella skyensis]MDP8084691.1 hypothetical protein [Pasteurella skyensis]
MNVINNLGATKYIVLPFNRQEITFTNRNGDDLLVKLSSGEVVRVKDFFDMPRHLLLNPEQGKYIQLLDINDVSGSILSTKTLTSSEATALLGNDLHMLSSQASSDVLLSDGLYKGVAETSAMTTDDAISGAALGLGIFGAAVGIASTTGAFGSDSGSNSDNDSANSTETVTNPDGPTTTTTKTDTDGDGVADTTTVTEKDPSGKTTKETVTVDKNDDGKPDLVTETVTNDDGSTTTTTKEDTNDDGTVDSTTVAEDKDGDGNPEKTTTTADTDGDGKDDTVTVSEDINDDGTIDKVTTTVDMNEDGKPEKVTEIVKNADGSTITTTQEDTNGNGTLETKSIAEDKDSDGNPEKTVTTIEDSKGRITSTETATDQDSDGNPEEIITVETSFSPNSGVNPKTTNTVERDSNDDGELDKTIDVTHVSRAGIVTTEKGEVLYRAADGSKAIKYTNDENNEVRTEVVDKNGHTTRIETDYQGDGKIDSITTIEHDEENHQVKYLEDSNGNGTIDKDEVIEVYTMDENNEYNISRVYSYGTEENINQINEDTYGKLWYLHTYDYNNDGQKDAYNFSLHNEKEQIVEQRRGKYYDELENITDIKDVVGTDTISVEGNTYEYNDEGRMSVRSNYASVKDIATDKVSSEHFYEYDNSTDLLTKETVYNGHIEDNKVSNISHYEYNNSEEKVARYYDNLTDGENIDYVNIYGNHTVSESAKFDISGMSGIGFNKEDVTLTITDDTLDKIANDVNSHKVFVDSSLSGDELRLEGNFTKTIETESRGGQDYVKYTDEVGNAFIVDPDVTVNII